MGDVKNKTVNIVDNKWYCKVKCSVKCFFLRLRSGCRRRSSAEDLELSFSPAVTKMKKGLVEDDGFAAFFFLFLRFNTERKI